MMSLAYSLSIVNLDTRYFYWTSENNAGYINITYIPHIEILHTAIPFSVTQADWLCYKKQALRLFKIWICVSEKKKFRQVKPNRFCWKPSVISWLPRNTTCRTTSSVSKSKRHDFLKNKTYSICIIHIFNLH